jgi:hypothetical protein
LPIIFVFSFFGNVTFTWINWELPCQGNRVSALLLNSKGTCQLYDSTIAGDFICKMEPAGIIPQIILLLPLFFFLWDWGLNLSGLRTCKADALPLRSHLQSIFLWLFWGWLASNCNPPDFSLPSS